MFSSRCAAAVLSLTGSLAIGVASDLSAQVSASPPAAVVIDRQTVAQGRIVALGRDLEVHGRALSDVAAINGSIHVDGTVEGDVIALGGDVLVGAGARIDGDVLALGGVVTSAGEATVRGRSVAYPTASASWLVLVEGPALGLSPWSSAVLGGKLALLGAWLICALVLVSSAAPGIRATAATVGEEPLRSFAVGIVAVLSLALSTALFSSFLGAFVGAPLLVLIVVAALLLKLWGVVAVCCWLGGLRRAPSLARHAVLSSTLLGLAVLGVVKFLPWLGVLAWTAASLVGMGAALRTKFGRREAWLGSAESLP